LGDDRGGGRKERVNGGRQAEDRGVANRDVVARVLAPVLNLMLCTECVEAICQKLVLVAVRRYAYSSRCRLR
jgi:hypothetical protein